MVYSSQEPQFSRVSAILKEEKITLQRFSREAVDDFSSEKPSSVAIPCLVHTELSLSMLVFLSGIRARLPCMARALILHIGSLLPSLRSSDMR